ncbi:MAG: radical SAM protein [Spirochaetales bacterium]|nr:radical SAM protein [Spirochaetales bacterium]
MNHTPTNSVWEITYACNMRCKHCGSSCGEKYPDELTLEEAYKVCDDLAELGMEVVTLSGGEPFLHPHWPEIAKRLNQNGVTVNAISNGWFIDKELIEKAKKAGIVNIGVSLDGLKETHDFIRRPGAFDHVMSALDAMNAEGMPTVICTSVNMRNFPELTQMKEVLYDKNVQRWQFQIASPMGNLLDHPDLICEMKDIDKLIDFSHEVMKEDRILVDLADDIGYFNIKVNEIHQKSSVLNKPCSMKQDCQAGKRVMGIRANGDITGCLSIRDNNFIEGNVKERDLKEIWNDEKAFSWNRNLTKDKLSGFCGKCQYANYCLGGCTGLKLTFSGSIYDNKYCSFRLAIENEEKRIEKITDLVQLKTEGQKALTDEEYQIADIYFEKVLKQDANDLETLNLLGFINYNLENYIKAKNYNVEVLKLDQKNAYAHKGLGLCLCALGELSEGIGHLNKAIEFADKKFTDPYFDLAVIYANNNQTQKAMETLEKGREISDDFKTQSQEFFESLKQNLVAVN